MTKLFDIRFALLEKSLDFRTQRNALLAGNVANLETPGYKSKDLVFERALGEAMRARQPGPLDVTNPRHLSGKPNLPVGEVKPRVIDTASADNSLDGNSVNLETEMAKIAENQLAYQALTQMIAHKFRMLKTVITEGEA